MSSPAAVPTSSPSSSTSTPSPPPTTLPHVPECPRFTLLPIGDRLYRQQIIPPPAGHSAAHQPPAQAAPATTAGRPIAGTSPQAASTTAPALDEALLAAVEAVAGGAGAGGTVWRLVVDVDCACVLSSVSRMQRRVVEDIECKYRTSITLPSKTPHSHTIVVTGADRESVVYSKHAIDQLVTTLIAESPYTHFLSLPLPSFQSTLQSFHYTLLASFPTTTGLHPSILVRPTSLHFTVLMLALPTPHHIQRASTALASLATTTPTPAPLSVRLHGLATMNDSQPQSAHVLYIRPDAPSQQRLAQLAARLVDGMRRAGVLSDREVVRQRLVVCDRATGQETAGVKWHATILNTKHRSRGGGGAGTGGRQRVEGGVAVQGGEGGGGQGGGGGRTGHGWNKRQGVDVRDILAQYGDVDWGEGAISACELSALSWDNKTQYYPCEAKLPL